MTPFTRLDKKTSPFLFKIAVCFGKCIVVVKKALIFISLAAIFDSLHFTRYRAIKVGT